MMYIQVQPPAPQSGLSWLSFTSSIYAVNQNDEATLSKKKKKIDNGTLAKIVLCVLDPEGGDETGWTRWTKAKL